MPATLDEGWIGTAAAGSILFHFGKDFSPKIHSVLHNGAAAGVFDLITSSLIRRLGVMVAALFSVSAHDVDDDGLSCTFRGGKLVGWCSQWKDT